jgi:protoporphyrinogen oxidase
MNIAIIGGGLTGLTAAYELLKSGHRVTMFEKEKTLGGLAGGFRMPHWLAGRPVRRNLGEGGSLDEGWSLEFFYHHFFTNDDVLINLAKELGLEKEMLILSPVTSVYWNKNQYPFDTPLTILKFPGIPFVDRLRTGATAACMKINPFWKPLERVTAKKLFRMINGKHAWNTIWEPLLDAKFGPYKDLIPASWLWARIKKRTPSLGYFRGGFQTLVNRLAEATKKQGGNIFTNTAVISIHQKTENRKRKADFSLSFSALRPLPSVFDAILITTPSSVATKLIKFPKPYEQKLKAIPHLWAQTLILETKEPILNKTYWLNITDPSFPFIAVVAHTNMVDKKYYGGNHITYIGNYLPDGHPYLMFTPKQLLKEFTPFIQKINPSFRPPTSALCHLFTAPAAQPVHTLNYSKKAPTIKTPIEGIYLANLDSIYPWDRGTNYAVELGQQAASTILNC